MTKEIKEEDLLRLWSEWVGAKELSAEESVAMDACINASWLPPSGTISRSKLTKVYSIYCKDMDKWVYNNKDWTSNQANAKAYKTAGKAKQGLTFMFDDPGSYRITYLKNYYEKHFGIKEPKRATDGSRFAKNYYYDFAILYGEYMLKIREEVSIVEHSVII